MKNHCEKGSFQASVLKPRAKRYTNWYIALNGFLLLYLCRYDFSEPQFGKDVCDRIISPLKSALTRYCNEGNDISSASDMHRALEARKVKGTTAAVCELDSNQAVVKVGRNQLLSQLLLPARGHRRIPCLWNWPRQANQVERPEY